jgi:hypothetical protein
VTFQSIWWLCQDSKKSYDACQNKVKINPPVSQRTWHHISILKWACHNEIDRWCHRSLSATSRPCGIMGGVFGSAAAASSLLFIFPAPRWAERTESWAVCVLKIYDHQTKGFTINLLVCSWETALHAAVSELNIYEAVEKGPTCHKSVNLVRRNFQAIRHWEPFSLSTRREGGRGRGRPAGASARGDGGYDLCAK